MSLGLPFGVAAGLGLLLRLASDLGLPFRLTPGLGLLSPRLVIITLIILIIQLRDDERCWLIRGGEVSFGRGG